MQVAGYSRVGRAGRRPTGASARRSQRPPSSFWFRLHPGLTTASRENLDSAAYGRRTRSPPLRATESGSSSGLEIAFVRKREVRPRRTLYEDEIRSVAVTRRGGVKQLDENRFHQKARGRLSKEPPCSLPFPLHQGATNPSIICMARRRPAWKAYPEDRGTPTRHSVAGTLRSSCTPW